jgi:hypothetical protein
VTAEPELMAVPDRQARMRLVTAIAVLALTSAAPARGPGSALAQDQPSRPDTADAPSVSDVMGQMQLRHFKLGYAGALGNWPLASYELGLVADSFHTTSALFSAPGDARLVQMLKQDATPPLTAIGNAIAAGSKEDFGRAFERLTEACNACHSAARVGFIRIKFPTTSRNFLFSNQIFPPE